MKKINEAEYDLKVFKAKFEYTKSLDKLKGLNSYYALTALKEIKVINFVDDLDYYLKAIDILKNKITKLKKTRRSASQEVYKKAQLNKLPMLVSTKTLSACEGIGNGNLKININIFN